MAATGTNKVTKRCGWRQDLCVINLKFAGLYPYRYFLGVHDRDWGREFSLSRLPIHSHGR
jgi:hypothetical protein